MLRHPRLITTMAPRAAIYALVAVFSLALLAGCSQEASYFRTNLDELEQPATLAVLPLMNLTRFQDAETIVMNALLVELLEAGLFEVVDPGLVETTILEQRLRVTDKLSLEQLQTLGASIGVRYLLLGAVNEFNMIYDENQQLPSVSISLRIVSCDDARIVWAASHAKRGDAAETVFGMGRVESLEQLTHVTVREMTATLKAQ